ncbi:MAG: class I SAM-dependent methyltransferase [Hydrogenophaga sp.]|jgi:SAM-dependent methyltransferase|nr:class I SAM-dependent methyltransferase [Hydrogenophaga sp.]
MRTSQARRLAAQEGSIRWRCPCCAAALYKANGDWHCQADVTHRFPCVDGVPVLLNPARSVFRADDFTPQARTTFKNPAAWALWLGRVLPSPSRDLGTERSLRALADALRLRPAGARRVLVIGCGDGTAGYGALEAVDGVELLETDVSLAGPAAVVCDASDLPFADGQWDLVIAVAVLEHVLEPQRCVDEMHRVLRADGLVYATTPFMQQVHMGEYDFTRFTRSGHRWLFRHFEELDSGIATGPASVLIWSIEYFLLSWTTSVGVRRVIKGLTRLLLGWATWLDVPLAPRPAACDAAGGFYFMGRRAEVAVVSAREMIRYYRGSDAKK